MAERSAKPSSLPEGVGDHGAFQRRMWAVQRVAWALFFAILVCCALGLLGRGGPFSSRTVTVSGGSVELPAFSRWSAPDTLTVTFAPSPADRVLLLDARFLELFSVEGVTPPQNATLSDRGRTGYVFPADPDASTRVVLNSRPQQPGLGHYGVGIGPDLAEASTFVFP